MESAHEVKKMKKGVVMRSLGWAKKRMFKKKKKVEFEETKQPTFERPARRERAGEGVAILHAGRVDRQAQSAPTAHGRRVQETLVHSPLRSTSMRSGVSTGTRRSCSVVGSPCTPTIAPRAAVMPSPSRGATYATVRP